MTKLTMLADVGGSGFFNELFAVFIIGLCCALLWWVGKWFIEKLGLPAVALTVWTGLFILVGLVVVVNFLLSLTGHPFLHYW